MILQTIRQSLLREKWTLKEDLLIGDTCLALTEKEREVIEHLDVTTYQAECLEGEEVADKITDAVVRAKIIGAASGAIVGGVGAGAIASRNTDNLVMIGCAGVAGGAAGGIAGYSAGKKIGYAKVIKEIKASPGYLQWQNEKFEGVIFPALSRYFDSNRWEQIQLICPITHSFMLEPVKAKDNRIYEKNAIVYHLNRWEFEWGSAIRCGCLGEEETADLWNNSPIRAGHIEIKTLSPTSDYYPRIFKKLLQHYNARVLEQKSIVALAKKERPPLTKSQIEKIATCYSETVAKKAPKAHQEPLTSKQVKKIIRFYTMDRKERNDLFSEIGANVLRGELSMEKKAEACAFLAEAVQLPRELRVAI